MSLGGSSAYEACCSLLSTSKRYSCRAQPGKVRNTFRAHRVVRRGVVDVRHRAIFAAGTVGLVACVADVHAHVALGARGCVRHLYLRSFSVRFCRAVRICGTSLASGEVGARGATASFRARVRTTVVTLSSPSCCWFVFMVST